MPNGSSTGCTAGDEGCYDVDDCYRADGHVPSDPSGNCGG